MAISLNSLQTLRNDKPPRVLIYGTPGIGKTTLASEFPNPVFIQLEDGTPDDIELPGWGRDKIGTFYDVIEAMGALYDEEHDFQTLVIDSMSEMQKLVFAETCNRGDENGTVKSRIEDYGYGKGYANAMEVWNEFIDAMNDLRVTRNMYIVLIAHAAKSKFDDPESASYNKYEIDLYATDKASTNHRGRIEREMDAICLVKLDVNTKFENPEGKKARDKGRVIADGGNSIWICTKGKPSYTAKNRYDMPAKILYRKGEGFAQMAPYFPNTQAPAMQAEAAE